MSRLIDRHRRITTDYPARLRTVMADEGRARQRAEESDEPPSVASRSLSQLTQDIIKDNMPIL
jgi:hypothetical protein